MQYQKEVPMTNNGTKHYFGKMNVQRRTELCYINKEKVDRENYPQVCVCNLKKH